MKVADLVAEQIAPWKHKLCEGRVIALDAMNGKVLFDTWKTSESTLRSSLMAKLPRFGATWLLKKQSSPLRFALF